MEDKLAEAKAFAIKAHLGQKRKGSGEDYAHHPLRVGDWIVNNYYLENEAIAGYLHDVIEDTDITYDDLVLQFGTTIAKLVWELTNDKETRSLYDSKAEYLLSKMESMSNSALLIKLVDRMDNISDMDDPRLSPDFVTRYMKETEYILNNIVFNIESRSTNGIVDRYEIKRAWSECVCKYLDMRKCVSVEV